MSKEIPALFQKTKLLEAQIDEFLDKIAEGAIHFEIGMTAFLGAGKVNQTAEEQLFQINSLKEKCSELRRAIVNILYTEMLIPDFRGNVLSLLTNLFSLLDALGKNFQELMIEHQVIEPLDNTTREVRENFMERESPVKIHTGIQKETSLNQGEMLLLVKMVVKSVEMVVVAARDFFRNPKAVRDHIYQVRVYESEADRISVRIKTKIFSSSLKFSHKINLRDKVNAIDAIADKAEEVADELSIYAIQQPEGRTWKHCCIGYWGVGEDGEGE